MYYLLIILRGGVNYLLIFLSPLQCNTRNVVTSVYGTGDALSAVFDLFLFLYIESTSDLEDVEVIDVVLVDKVGDTLVPVIFFVTLLFLFIFLTAEDVMVPLLSILCFFFSSRSSTPCCFLHNYYSAKVIIYACQCKSQGN